MNEIKIVPHPPVEAGEVGVEQLQYIPDASCSSIEIGDILDYVPAPDRQGLLSNILTKLAYEGSIKITAMDAIAVCRLLITNQIPLDHFNHAIFNPAKRSISESFEIVNMLQNAGLEIEEQQIAQGAYYVKATRVQSGNSV